MMERLQKPLHIIAVVTGRLIAIFTVGFVCLFALMMLAFLTEDPAGSGCLGKQPYQNQLIEQLGRFKLPQSARNIAVSSKGFQDCVVYVNFDIDKADLASFLKSAKLVGPYARSEKPNP